MPSVGIVALKLPTERWVQAAFTPARHAERHVPPEFAIRRPPFTGLERTMTIRRSRHRLCCAFTADGPERYPRCLLALSRSDRLAIHGRRRPAADETSPAGRCDFVSQDASILPSHPPPEATKRERVPHVAARSIWKRPPRALPSRKVRLSALACHALVRVGM
jgi:hypothetical protein